jgi:hypothetical protein
VSAPLAGKYGPKGTAKILWKEVKSMRRQASGTGATSEVKPRTIRDYLNLRLGRAYLMIFVFMGIFALGAVLSGRNKAFTILPLISFPIIVAYIIKARRGVRCPKCKKPIGWLPGESAGWAFRFSDKIKCCPYCGIDLDTALSEIGVRPD